MRCIVDSRVWQTQRGINWEYISRDKIFKHFPALDPHSEDAEHHKRLLDELSESNEAVREQLQSDKVPRGLVGRVCELAEFLTILYHTPNLEELRFRGEYQPVFVPSHACSHAWGPILAAIPHGFTLLRTVEFYNQDWADAQCYDAISWILSLPSLNTLQFGVFPPPSTLLSDPQEWTWPVRSSPVQHLTVSLRPTNAQYNSFFLLLFAACKSLVSVSLVINIEDTLSIVSSVAIIQSLGELHGSSLRRLAIRWEFCRHRGHTPLPSLALSIYRNLQYLGIEIHRRSYSSMPEWESDDPNVQSWILPENLETHVVFRNDNSLPRHVERIVKLLKSGALPNFMWLGVGRGSSVLDGSIRSHPFRDEACWKIVEFDKSRISGILESTELKWSFADLLLRSSDVLNWRVEVWKDITFDADVSTRQSLRDFRKWGLKKLV